jgi:cyclophilin family peptidyl-prolyl cis-trans isomerase
MCIDAAKKYTATFDTSEGTVVVDLNTKLTPKTTNNFVVLSRYKYYDGTPIFRTDPSIDIIQGGGPNNTSGPGYTIPDEGGKFAYTPGDLVMARSSGANSGGAQFFFAAGENTALLDDQGTYVTFGHVSKGLDVVKAILALHQADNSGMGGAPSRTVTINSLKISES